jgi:hypothetical protein
MISMTTVGQESIGMWLIDIAVDKNVGGGHLDMFTARHLLATA